jgi:hypothetical protein
MAIMDDIEIINALNEQLRSLDESGITAKTNFADQPEERHQPAAFDSERFVRLRAVKRGKTQQVEFRQIVEIEEVRRPSVATVADHFCKCAANALAKIDLE